MKVILYMTITVDGFIARNDDSSDFITEVESESYAKNVLKAGALIVGRRTYGILSKQSEFQEFLKAGVKIVAVSHKNFEVNPNHFVANSPKEALKILKDSKEVIVAGGGGLNASFLAENLIDEIYVDIEPVILGEGIPLFRDNNFETKLELLDTKKLSENEIQLHYKVLK